MEQDFNCASIYYDICHMNKFSLYTVLYMERAANMCDMKYIYIHEKIFSGGRFNLLNILTSAHLVSI